MSTKAEIISKYFYFTCNLGIMTTRLKQRLTYLAYDYYYYYYHYYQGLTDCLAGTSHLEIFCVFLVQ